MTCYRQGISTSRSDIPVFPFFPLLTSRLEPPLRLLGKLKAQAELRAQGRAPGCAATAVGASCVPFLQKHSAAGGSQLGPFSPADACQCLETRLLVIIGWAGGTPGCRVLGRGHGCCSTSPSAQNILTQQRTVQPEMSVVREYSGAGCHALLQGISLTQTSISDVPCIGRQVLCHLGHLGHLEMESLRQLSCESLLLCSPLFSRVSLGPSPSLQTPAPATSPLLRAHSLLPCFQQAFLDVTASSPFKRPLRVRAC